MKKTIIEYNEQFGILRYGLSKSTSLKRHTNISVCMAMKTFFWKGLIAKLKILSLEFNEFFFMR